MSVHALPHAYLAAAYALKGDTGRARAELTEAQNSKRRSLFQYHTAQSRGIFRRTEGCLLVRSNFFVGLRRAGMQED